MHHDKNKQLNLFVPHNTHICTYFYTSEATFLIKLLFSVLLIKYISQTKEYAQTLRSYSLRISNSTQYAAQVPETTKVGRTTIITSPQGKDPRKEQMGPESTLVNGPMTGRPRHEFHSIQYKG
jgi:hypothetical protein